MSFRTGPLILFYSPFFGGMPNLFKLNCETACRFTADRRRLPEANVVLFHLPTMRGLEFPKRYSGQRWVLFSMESNVNFPALVDPDFMRQFDITMGYWREATVWTPYFNSATAKLLRSRPVEKTEPVSLAYFQSSQFDASGRIGYVRALMKHMQVDSYGRVLNTRQLQGPDRGKNSKLRTIARYKFTLAFENSIATDYVTEKFFQPLIAGSVPVYLGAPNIADYAPGKDCFINLADFDGPASLAAHLKRISADEAEYGKLLAWKAQPLRPQFLEMAKSADVWFIHRLCGIIGDRVATGPGSTDGLSAFGRFSNRSLIRWLSAPALTLPRHLVRLLRH
jgi:Glycosyltransferase family 10 (fucosyltransferase) C-term/Fucosyltransferase, N-terminal